MLDIHPNLNVALTRRINDRSLRTFHKQWSFGKRGALERKVFSPLITTASLTQLLYLLSQLIKQHVSANYTSSSGYK